MHRRAVGRSRPPGRKVFDTASDLLARHGEKPVCSVSTEVKAHALGTHNECIRSRLGQNQEVRLLIPTDPQMVEAIGAAIVREAA